MNTGAYTIEFKKDAITISITMDVLDDNGLFADLRELVEVADEAIWVDLGISPIETWEYRVTGPWNPPILQDDAPSPS